MAALPSSIVAANSNVTFAGVISGGTKGINLRQVTRPLGRFLDA